MVLIHANQRFSRAWTDCNEGGECNEKKLVGKDGLMGFVRGGPEKAMM